MSSLPREPESPRTWIAIEDPDAVCAAYERLWEHGTGPGDPPFAASPASAAVEAMAWDPWSHFDGTTWDSAWLADGDRQVRVAAKAFVEEDEGTPRRVGRRVASGVRITDRLGRVDTERPPEVRSGRLVLECALTVRDHREAPPTWRTRIEAGSVITVLPAEPRSPEVRSRMSSVEPR